MTTWKLKAKRYANQYGWTYEHLDKDNQHVVQFVSQDGFCIVERAEGLSECDACKKLIKKNSNRMRKEHARRQ